MRPKKAGLLFEAVCTWPEAVRPEAKGTPLARSIAGALVLPNVP